MPFVKTLTDLFSASIGGGGVDIQGEFDKISKQLEVMEANLKQNAYNVTQMGNIDNRFVQLVARTESLTHKIGNITKDKTLSDAEKLQGLADLINSSEIKELEYVLNMTTESFTSTQVDGTANRNVFEAAFQLACGDVMFSGEALDVTMPYLTRQLASYLHAYIAMGLVYQANEKVYGAGHLNGELETMSLGPHRAGSRGKAPAEVRV